jgi:MFS family permease
MLQSFAMAALALSGLITVWHIVALAAVQGVVNAFDLPARQSFVVEMVENRADLPNAIALNSSMVNGARLIGPALAGVIISAVGEAWCFVVDGASYLAVILSLLSMRVVRRSASKQTRRVGEQLREGWTYVSESVPIRSILLLLGLVSLAGMPYTVLMPVIASEVLHGGPNTLGILMAASGLGALAGAFSLAIRKSVLGLGRRIVLCSGLFGLGLIAFGWSTHLWVSLLIMPVMGFSMMQHMASSNTILQTIVDDQKRGRVMAFFSMAFQGMAPFGSLLAGTLAAYVGTRWTLVLSGLSCLAGCLWFSGKLKEIRRILRPVYVQLGILPQAALGVQQASTLQSPEAS